MTDTKYYLKYLKYKKKYLEKTTHKGGVITEEQRKRMHSKQYTMSLINIFGDYVIQQLFIDGSLCDGIFDDITFINTGANGFAISFKCKNNKKYIAKFIYNHDEQWENENPYYEENINKEYNDLMLFNSENIIKAYCKFIFKSGGADDILGKITITSNNGERKILDVIPNDKYKYTEGDRINFFPLNFGGVVVEYVEYEFMDLKDKNILERMNIIQKLKLFRGYVNGLRVMHMAGYVHGDIKPNNLRFSIEGENYIGKIIDIDVFEMTGNIFYRSVGFQNSGLSLEITALVERREVEKKRGNLALVNTINDEIKEKTKKGDLFALAFSCSGKEVNPTNLNRVSTVNLFEGNTDATTLIEDCLSSRYDLYNINDKIDELIRLNEAVIPAVSRRRTEQERYKEFLASESVETEKQIEEITKQIVALQEKLTKLKRKT